MKIIIRERRDEDQAFVYATFLRGLYYGSSWYGTINKKSFMDNYPAVLDKILEKDNTQLKIACLSQDENVILGYCIVEGPVLHWIAVKEAWRGQGIAKKLLAGSEITHVTHLTKVGSLISKQKGWIHNPFLI